jgi:Bacterial SH3 domain
LRGPPSHSNPWPGVIGAAGFDRRDVEGRQRFRVWAQTAVKLNSDRLAIEIVFWHLQGNGLLSCQQSAFAALCLRMRYPGTFWFAGPVVLLAVLAGCQTKPKQTPVIGTAWAGPVSLKLRKDIDSKSPVVATVPHGEKLDIVGRRRLWYKVRTEKGVEGWTSDRQLLDKSQIQRLRSLARETAGMPSQGVATTFETLNVHMEPSRLSPSFTQVAPKEKVDVIAHRVTPRTAEALKRELISPAPKLQKKPAKKDAKTSKTPTPPVPPPPGPPADWLDLSQPHDPEPTEAADAAPVRTDDWTLVRTPNGESGWVLTSGLYLAIPDEVAQYAEGHRIMSYFSLGKIDDDGLQKNIWLWTTAETLGEDHDFDGFRVFVWSLRHHRYETSYIQRRERGFFPVLAKQGEFSVCLEQDDGSRVRKQFTMTGNAVHLAGVQPCEKTAEQEVSPEELLKADAKDQASKKNLVERVKDKAKGLFGETGP